MSLKSAWDRAVARLLAPFPAVPRRWAERTALERAEGAIPWTPFAGPFSRARVAVLTTGGFHLPDQAAFDCDRGDPSWRALPADVDLRALAISHTHYDTRDARRDPNILLPLERLRELVREGAIGALAPTQYSLMGFAPQIDALTGETAPAVAARLSSEEVDLLLLTPA